MNAKAKHKLLAYKTFFTKFKNENFVIFVLINHANMKYSIVLSLNVEYIRSEFYDDAKTTIIEIIENELNEPFLDWFHSIDKAIEAHFSSWDLEQ
ncbi:MAG: hypothetical protein Q4G13_02575 [Moraxella sp.]|nr:hypothetical protein [Moraxella sp.]